MTKKIEWPASPWKAWRVVLIAALFFFYEFIQMNMLNTISTDMLKNFHLTAASLGFMSSFYFMANLIFLFIAGMLLDRYSTRAIMLISLGICVVSTFLFGLATTITWVIVCRFLTGIGSAFCFLSVLRLISRWFPPQRMALATGVVVTMAMVGGMVAQTPFSLLTDALGWRSTLMIDAGLGLFIWLCIAMGVRDYPVRCTAQHQAEQVMLDQLGYWSSLRLAFLKPQNWLGGLFTSTINLPINVLGGLWGSMYLMTQAHLSDVNAATVSSMLFIGMVVGSPLVGWLSDMWARRKPLMILGACLSLGLIGFLWVSHIQNFISLCCLFGLIGFVSSTQIIGYPLVSESNPRVVTAMAVSVVNITTISGIGFIQWLFGLELEKHALHRLGHLSVAYAPSDFHAAMLIFVIGMGVALCAAVCVRETYGRQVNEAPKA